MGVLVRRTPKVLVDDVGRNARLLSDRAPSGGVEVSGVMVDLRTWDSQTRVCGGGGSRLKTVGVGEENKKGFH